jgi:hypothetical protein
VSPIVDGIALTEGRASSELKSSALAARLRPMAIAQIDAEVRRVLLTVHRDIEVVSVTETNRGLRREIDVRWQYTDRQPVRLNTITLPARTT